MVNDTIAWNVIGVWAGDTGPQQSNAHASAFVNVVFDPASPPGAAVGFSCFEGLRDIDMRVSTRGGLAVGLAFNAWVPALSNLGTPFPPEAFPWSAASTGIGGSLSPFGPRVDLTPYAAQPRTLYINDAFRNSPVGGVGTEYSSHDFRLCPGVSATGSPPGTLGVSNPLVNAGIDGGPLFALDILMVNGRMIPGQGPGWDSVPPDNVEDAFIGAWDYDADGFGNPRIATPPGYPLVGDGFGTIDIGADETDRLIVGGFWENTRILASTAPGSLGIPPHDRVYFFGLTGTGSPRPQANSFLGREFGWYEHLQAPTDTTAWAGLPSNYTGVPFPGSLRQLLINDATLVTGAPLRPIMRNLECDFSPHLLLDIHPFWGQLLAIVDPFGFPVEDPYASNPWYHYDPGTFAPQVLLDNPALYNNLFLPAHDLPDYAPLMPFDFTAVVQATLNPPGTFVPAAQWILSPSSPFGPVAPCTGVTLAFGPWSFNDTPTGCPDLIPYIAGEDGLGRRYNLEVGPGESNLQTFLRVQADVLPPVGEFRNAGWESLRDRIREFTRRLGGRD